MMPVSLLIALLIAFGIEPPTAGVPRADVVTRVLETFGGIALIASLAFGLGFWVAFRASHIGSPMSRIRQRYALGVRLITFLSLVVYGWIIHYVGWSKLVRTNWGLDGAVLFDDVVVFLPFVLIQLLVWWGLFFAERALQISQGIGLVRGLGRYLVLKGRQSLGLTLPVILMYVIRSDVIRRFVPSWEEHVVGGPLEIAVLGFAVLAMSPLFVRLAWPTYSLPPGALRRRLERAAERVGFRFTDILVWDTGQMVVNACVTGILPRFRYILLSDSLLDSLTPHESAAVFGHEIGHVAHRHFLYFAFFFMGSLGVLTIFGDLVSLIDPPLTYFSWLTPRNAFILKELLKGSTLLIALGLYFWFIFGYLSRRFERQADVYGSKVVSCDMADCPPHTDLDNELAPERAVTREPSLCPVGIRIFADALTNVARFNGLDRRSPSWRHGSIASRISFLEALERHPEREVDFQRQVRRLRLGLGFILAGALAISAAGQIWELFH
jgi:STE24 endopeptidase